MTPTAFVTQCEFCQRDIDTREPGVHQRTSGWVKNRSGGGGHAISLPVRETRFACGYCIDRATKGFLKQESLL